MHNPGAGLSLQPSSISQERRKEREKERERANERDVGAIHSLSVSMQMLYDVHLKKIHGNLGSDHQRNTPEHESGSFAFCRKFA